MEIKKISITAICLTNYLKLMNEQKWYYVHTEKTLSIRPILEHRILPLLIQSRKRKYYVGKITGVFGLQRFFRLSVYRVSESIIK